MKVFDIEKYIKNLWFKIDEVDKKSFIVFFISMNIVFIYNSLHCLFGIHDIFSLFDKISPVETNYIGRYSVTWLEYFISNKTVIPLFINLILFFFMSISTVLVLHWLNIKKTLFDYLFSGLFLLLNPCLYVVLWYRTSCFGHLITIFFTIISFFIVQKINNETDFIKKTMYFIISMFLMIVFVFGAYPPALCIVLGLILVKILVDLIDSNFSCIKQILANYKNLFFLSFFSLLVSYLIFKLFEISGLIELDEYNSQIISFSNLSLYLHPFLTKTVNSFLFETYPYIGGFYKTLLILIVLFSVISVCIYVFSKEKNVLSFFKKCLFIILFFFVIFYAFNIVFLLSPMFYDNPRLFRLEYWTTIYFVFVCISICLKYKNIFIKNVMFILLCLTIIVNIQINMHIQKDQMIEQQVELSRIMTLKNLILSNKNYEYTDEIKYEFVRVGYLKEAGYIEIYNSNKFNNNYFCELYQTFLSIQSFFETLVDIPPKINNINPYASNLVSSYAEVKKYLQNNDFKNWILNDANAYPSPECVFINKGKIFVIFEPEIIDMIRFELEQDKIN